MTWLEHRYASENTIDKRSRYVEAVNHQGIVGCTVLRDGILHNTSQALLKFAKRIESLKFNGGPYAIIGEYVVSHSSNKTHFNNSEQLTHLHHCRKYF